jgi:large subunit ribosomal protein L18
MSYEERRTRRHFRIRKRIFGSSERPRLAVYRSQKHIHAQIIDDYEGKTLFSFSTNSEKFRKVSTQGRSVEAAQKLGELLGPELISKGIQKVVFDRGGYRYHGRIKALAEGLRSKGVNL